MARAIRAPQRKEVASPSAMLRLVQLKRRHTSIHTDRKVVVSSAAAAAASDFYYYS